VEVLECVYRELEAPRRTADKSWRVRGAEDRERGARPRRDKETRDGNDGGGIDDLFPWRGFRCLANKENVLIDVPIDQCLPK
jgi:hypothetical protein